MGLLKNVVKAVGRGLVKVAESTKRVNERIIAPVTDVAARFDPVAQGLMKTGWFKQHGQNVNPVSGAWRTATIYAPGTKTGQTVLPIAGGLVGGFFGGAAGAGAGAGFGRAVAGVHSGEDRGKLAESAGWAALATSAAAGAGAVGATYGGIAGRAGATLATQAAIARAQGASNQQITQNFATSAAGMAGGYLGGQAGLMSGSEGWGRAGSTLGGVSSNTAAKLALAKLYAPGLGNPPSALPATAPLSSVSGQGFQTYGQAYLQNYRKQMSPTNWRTMYSHLA